MIGRPTGTRGIWHYVGQDPMERDPENIELSIMDNKCESGDDFFFLSIALVGETYSKRNVD